MLLPVDQVIHALTEQAEPISSERIALNAASRRVLAEDIVAQIRVPPADNSAMDGYAVRLADIQLNSSLQVSQRIPAGTAPTPLMAGTAARIFTGAQIPKDADTVIMQENAEASDDSVRFTEIPDSSGANIRRAGEDIQIGTTILHRGAVLRPQELGLIASVGVDQISVFKRLRVAVLSTGSELVEPGTPLQTGQIYNSNRPMILAMLESLGIEAIDMGICADTLAGTQAALNRAAKEADVVITSGGVSVGEEDHVKAAVEELGELNLWKVAIKPGKPFAFGKIGASRFIGLPGNPASVFTTFLILARPFLLRCQGHKNVCAPAIKVPASFSRKPVRRQEYLRVRITDGQLELFPNQGSGVLTSACWGAGFAVQPIDQEVSTGQLLDYLPFSSLLTP